MPRIITERLVGYHFAVQTEIFTVPKQDITADGGDPTTSPEEIPVTVLIAIDQAHGHRIELPMRHETKSELLQLLTGGVVVAQKVPA